MAESNIITGQYVRINQTAASVGERMLARIIDTIINIIYVVGAFIVLTNIFTRNLELSDTGKAMFVIFVYLPFILYDFLFETLNNGRSPGKMIMNIKVVKQDGSTPGLGDYLLRCLLYIIEGPMLMYFGLLFIAVTENSQRIGDIAAGTMVIKTKSYLKSKISLDEFSYVTDNYKPVFPQAADLSFNQANVIMRTLYNFTNERNTRISTLSMKVHNMLKIPYIPQYANDEKFLYTIARDYQHYSMETAV